MDRRHLAQQLRGCAYRWIGMARGRSRLSDHTRRFLAQRDRTGSVGDSLRTSPKGSVRYAGNPCSQNDEAVILSSCARAIPIRGVVDGSLATPVVVKGFG